VELFVLPLGEGCCRHELMAPGVRDGERIHAPSWAFLVALSDGQLLLVDTGMNRRHISDPALTWRGTDFADQLIPVMRPEDSLIWRLAELDIAPHEVSYVINTHLHFDHAGNNDLLVNATIFVQREHYDFAKDNSSCPNQYWDLPNLRYELLDGEGPLLPGVSVIVTPGHAPGHQSVLLELDNDRNVILCGDAIFSEENVQYESWGSQGDPEVAQRTAERLRTIALERDALMIYGHDPAQSALLRGFGHPFNLRSARGVTPSA